MRLATAAVRVSYHVMMLVTTPTISSRPLTRANSSGYPLMWGSTYTSGEPLILVIPEAIATDVRALKHEYVHYLLRMSGFPKNLNEAHQSPFFVNCAGY